MSEDLLLVERKDRVCTLILNRPDRRNSLNPELLLKLGDTLNELRKDNEVRAVIIRGYGEQAFSSGFDIGRIPAGRKAAPSTLQEDPLRYGLESVASFPYPVLAMIYGYAVGGGLELAVTCDLRLAADTATLGIPPAKLGVVYSHVGILRFLNTVGVPATKELFFTGRLVTAQRAREMGLVDFVVPQAELASLTYALAQEIAENAPLSVKGAKIIIHKLLSYQKYGPEDEAAMVALREQAMQSEDLKEGQRAFLEKRKPRFVGR